MSAGHAHHVATKGALTQRAAIASVSVALFLVALKLWATIETHSVALLGSLADSTLDILASLVTLFAVRLSAQPADDQHGFGHGKAEALAALFQTGLTSAAAVAIGWRAAARLGSSTPPEHPELGIGVSLVAMAATLGLVLYQRMVVRETGSVAIHADHVHYSSDLLLNASVIAALVLEAMLHVHGADAVLGMFIALWLLWQAYGVARHAVDQLMDKEWPDARRNRFIELASTHAQVRGVHDVRTRTGGIHDFAQFHIWVDPAMTVQEAHRVMDEVEAGLRVEFPATEILIHPDPDGHADPERGEG